MLIYRFIIVRSNDILPDLFTKMTEENIYQLDPDEELRIEVECPKNEHVVVELRSGMAEVFGTEMVQGS